jgi:16S rRNA (guanine1207-N2)-methyltransferase
LVKNIIGKKYSYGGESMTDHYFSNKPSVASDVHEFDFQLRGKTFHFLSDAGVFSKHRVDFGSVLLIEEMQMEESADVLDMGCGYGPVGIVAATLACRGHVTMADVNERAVDLAKKNVGKNHIENVTVIVSDLFTNIPETQKFDVILTNPPIRAGKRVVHQLFEEAYQRLKEKGVLWVVIQKKQGGPSAQEKLASLFTTVEKVTQDKGYWILKAEKC